MTVLAVRSEFARCFRVFAVRFPLGKPTFPDMRGNGKDAPFPAVRAAALFVPGHLPATYVCAYYSLLNFFVRAQAKR
jgi:hypothetical protein